MKTNILKIISIATLSAAPLVANDMFVGVSTGLAYQNIDQEDHVGTITIGNELEKRGYNFKLEAGYHYNPAIDIVINYQRVEFDDTYLHNFFVSSEYKYKKYNDMTPYLGAQLGFSQMNWKKKPMNTSNNKYTSESYFIGALAGISYPIDEKLSLNVTYNFQYMDHDTQLASTPAHSTLTHNYFHSFNVGFRWEF